MLKKIFVFGVLISVALTGFADVMDNFKAGGMEFGGDLMIDYRPGYPVFNSVEKEADEGEYYLTIEGSANVGIFIIDNLSLSFIPTVFYMASKYNNGDGTFDIYKDLYMGFNVGAAYYTKLGSSIVLSPGLEAGITFLPGIDNTYDDIKETDDSLINMYIMKPTISAFYFMGENFAPYVKIGTQFTYYRAIKNSDGSDVVYASDYSIMDNVYLNITTTFGFKYFLPNGFRFLSGKIMNIADLFNL